MFGNGGRFSDCEYGWDDHGAAVFGESIATDNGYGETAIANAIADSDAGDVILLEMQTVNFGNSYGPPELDPDVFNIVQAGTQSGVVVVGAAGNGDQNLESGTYNTYMGWGYSVFSTGYGDAFLYGGGEHQSYTAMFSGTSSASGMVAGVACLIQSRSVALNGVGLAPTITRQIMKDTGIPQGAGGNIGPVPDAGAAVAAIGPYTDDPWLDLGLGLAGAGGEPVMTPSGPLAYGSNYAITVSNARTLSNCWLVVGLTNQSVPFKGGTLVPTDDLLIGPLPTGFGGTVTHSGVFPPGIPAGSKLYFQWWVKDPTGPVGFSASNAFEGTCQ